MRAVGLALVLAAGCFGGHDPNPTIASSDCELCHAGDDVAHTEPQPPRCVACHDNQAWVPVSHDGHDALFPIGSGEHRGLDCAECHPEPAGAFEFTCTGCHEHRQDRMDDEHAGVSGYRYESASCLRCHPTGGA